MAYDLFQYPIACPSTTLVKNLGKDNPLTHAALCKCRDNSNIKKEFHLC